MEKITLNNEQVRAKLHYLAMFCYKQVATYNKAPAPDVSFKRLRDKKEEPSFKNLISNRNFIHFF